MADRGTVFSDPPNVFDNFFRINKAKGYLEEQAGLSIREVSSMVGYVNCESFI